jgi:superfamily I DNA/RNA helicase
MRERLAKLIGEKLESRLILGTFHSICRRYLVKYGYLIGLRKGFGIADSDDTRAIIRVCFGFIVIYACDLSLIAVTADYQTAQVEH